MTARATEAICANVGATGLRPEKYPWERVSLTGHLSVLKLPSAINLGIEQRVTLSAWVNITRITAQLLTLRPLLNLPITNW